MKKITILLAVCSLLAALAGCAKTINEPETPSNPDSEPVSAQFVTGEDEKQEPSASDETEAEEEETTKKTQDTEADEDDKYYYRPTELVTYSEEGIPLSNAYFSLKLPADWDGHYTSATAYDENDVMVMTFRELSSIDGGADGVLFSLALIPEGTDAGSYGGETVRTLSTSYGKYSICKLLPEEKQYTSSTKKQYKAMAEQIDGIIGTLEPGYGWTFE